MLQRTQGSTTTNLHWDGWDLVREEKDDDVDIEVTNYLVPHGEILAFERDDEWFYLHGDGLSSTQLVTDDTGAQAARIVYGAWGEQLSVNDSVPGGLDVRFVGGLGVRNDSATGLVWMRHRWFDPTLNRFISRDPIGIEGGYNLYQYAEANPVTHIDPEGLNPPIGPTPPCGGGPAPWPYVKDWAHGAADIARNYLVNEGRGGGKIAPNTRRVVIRMGSQGLHGGRVVMGGATTTGTLATVTGAACEFTGVYVATANVLCQKAINRFLDSGSSKCGPAFDNMKMYCNSPGVFAGARAYANSF